MKPTFFGCSITEQSDPSVSLRSCSNIILVSTPKCCKKGNQMSISSAKNQSQKRVNLRWSASTSHTPNAKWCEAAFRRAKMKTNVPYRLPPIPITAIGFCSWSPCKHQSVARASRDGVAWLIRCCRHPYGQSYRHTQLHPRHESSLKECSASMFWLVKTIHCLFCFLLVQSTRNLVFFLHFWPCRLGWSSIYGVIPFFLIRVEKCFFLFSEQFKQLLRQCLLHFALNELYKKTSPYVAASLQWPL